MGHVNHSLHTSKHYKFYDVEQWRDDYADMRRFFIYGKSIEFDALMQKMAELHERVRAMKI